MKPDLRKRALQAYRLRKKNITGKELAGRLKLDPNSELDVERARDLADIGSNIASAEECDLTQLEWEALKAIARVSARQVERGDDIRVRARDVDFAAHKRTGWCWKIVTKRLSVETLDGVPSPTQMRFVHIMPNERRLWLTAAGWAYVWGARLVKANWRVPA